ncbi:hypothetical protein [uncultured Gimesia sp.]|uniref:hypothetical protein n=1 Tax=uncultured Gimesia sp. TaxID=1678688 RepID=UPI00260A97A4|nr:hypothetical protein [uncultured Gimesia sp.]
MSQNCGGRMSSGFQIVLKRGGFIVCCLKYGAVFSEPVFCTRATHQPEENDHGKRSGAVKTDLFSGGAGVHM